MSKKKEKINQVVKNKGKNDAKINSEIITMKKDELINIYAEAYYQAFKRLENEREPEVDKEDFKWYERLAYVLNVLFFPWVISHKFKIKEKAYDNMLVFVVTYLMEGIGAISWCVGIVGLGCEVINLINKDLKLLPFVVGIYCLFFGSIMTISADKFSEETNPDRIYGFGSIIFAMISCVISIVAVIK